MKFPFLHDVRRGLATNSSSSHSLVFFAEPVADDNVASANGADTEFGWNHFRLSSLGEKLMYALTQAVGGSWRGRPTDEDIAEYKEKWAHLFPEFADRHDLWVSAAEGYVDHQSRQQPDEEFMAKIRDPHVEVWGGNDNDGSPFETDSEWNYIPPAGATKIESIG